MDKGLVLVLLSASRERRVYAILVASSVSVDTYKPSLSDSPRNETSAPKNAFKQWERSSVIV